MDRDRRYGPDGATHGHRDADVLAPGRRTLSEDHATSSAAPPAVSGAAGWTSTIQPIGAETARELGFVPFDPAPDPAPVFLDAESATGDVPADATAIAAAGVSSPSSPLPHLATIQAAFGHHDVSGVRAHVGGSAAAAASALGARGYATGDHVAFAHEPDLRLAAHEAAHTVQQRGGVRLDTGVSRPGDVYERNADEVAERVVRGESAQDLLDAYADRGADRGGTSGPAIQLDTEQDDAWLSRLGHDGEGRWTRGSEPLSGPELQRLRRVLIRRARGQLQGEQLAAYERYVARAAAPLDAASWLAGGGARRAPGAAPTTAATLPSISSSSAASQPELERSQLDDEREATLARRAERHAGTDSPVEGDEGQRAISGTTREGPRGTVLDRAEGGRDLSLELDEEGNEARVEEIDERRRRVQGGQVISRHVRGHGNEPGRRVEVVDPEAMARELRPSLESDRDRIERELDEIHEDPAQAARRQQLRAQQEQLNQEIAALERDDVSPETVDRIARRHRLPVQPRYRTREGDVTTETSVIDANPLDGRVGTSQRIARQQDGADGRTVTTEDQHTEVDLGAGQLEQRHGTERTRTDRHGNQSTRRSSTTTRDSMGGGRAGRTEIRREETEERDDEGNVQSRTATERESGGSVIVSEDETGGRFHWADRREQEAMGDSSSVETAGALEVTDRRVGGTVGQTREQRRGGISTRQKVAADGSFSMDIEAIDDGSGQYRLTFRIHLGVTGSARLGGQQRRGQGSRGAHGSVTGGASAQGDLVTVRVLSEAEAQRYLDAAARADRGERVRQPAEFERIERMRVLSGESDVLAQSRAAFDDPSAAAGMRSGDSITLDTRVEVEGEAEAGYDGGRGGLAVEGGAGRAWRRTVGVERIELGGQPRVRVTVTYQRDDEWHVGGTASVSQVGAVRGRHQEERSDIDSVQFVLDPGAGDYDERYRAIVATTDRDQLRRLEQRYRDSVRRSTREDSDETDSEAEVGPSSDAMIGMRERTHGRDRVTVVRNEDGEPVRLEGTVEGGSEQDVRLRAGGTNVDLGGAHEQVRGELGQDGMEVEVSDAEQSINPAAALAEARDDFAEADARGRMAQVVARSPREHLTHMLRQFNHRWGYRLSEHDLDVLAQRARDERRWSACCIVPDAGVLRAWRQLRGSLMRPQLDPEEARVDEHAATQLAHTRALGTWMRSADGEGFECLEKVLRRWGESRTTEASGERLGRGYEWPVSLRQEATRYEALVGQVRGIGARFERELSQPDGKGEARQHFLDVAGGLDSVLRGVRNSTDFRSEARRTELIQELQQHRSDVHRQYRDFQRRWQALHPARGQGAAQGADQSADQSADQVTRIDREAVEATRASTRSSSQARARGFVRALIRTLRDNHTRESQLLRRASALIPENPSPYTGRRALAEATSLCSQVHDLHLSWIRQVQDLRQAYTQADIPEAEWEVSTGPSARRNYNLEPNIGWLINVYRRAMVFSGDAYLENRISEWRAQARY